ncbi:MAG: nucleoside triphosphate pyrophosphohydrolase [Bacillota bacterium]
MPLSSLDKSHLDSQARLLVVGLGPGSREAIPSGTWAVLAAGAPIWLRTRIHPTVAALEEAGVTYRSFDDLYDTLPTFDQIYDAIVDRLLTEAEKGRLVYAVPGHPLVAEDSVHRLLKRAEEAGVSVDLVAGASFLDALYTELRLDPSGGMTILDGLSLSVAALPRGRVPVIIAQVYDRQVASDVKLTLMERYPDDFPVTVVRGAGIPGERRMETHPLYELDRLDWVDHLTSLYLPPLTERPKQDDTALSRYPLDPLMQVVERLRAPEGCPWDREQTHQSLRPFVLEEAFEVAEALDLKDLDKLQEELGDLLLQVALHAAIAQELGEFRLADVVEGITSKLIRRHPHVFGDVAVSGTEEVLRNWEAIKRQEKRASGQDEPKSALAGVPVDLPALMRAYKLQKKASRLGFDWPDFHGAWDKVKEEMGELEEAYTSGDAGRIRDELGDLLFAVVNAARFLDAEPESALGATIAKFTRRFAYVEAAAARQGKQVQEMTLAEMDRYWEAAKESEYPGTQQGGRA